MKTIALEEHFVTKSFLKATGSWEEHGTGGMAKAVAAMRPKLLDLGAQRIAAMDEGSLDFAVLSLAALGIEKLDPATATHVLSDVNDELAAAVKSNPARLGGFAAVNLHDPAAAAKELERAITQLGFAGVMVDGMIDGCFLDDPKFLPFFEAAVALGVPVYLHPAPPPEPVMKTYYSGMGDVGHLLSIAGWGWHSETALHTLRLICSGLFDRLADLQLIIGHMGEMLPMALARSSSVLSGPAKLNQPVAGYFRSNIHITTSGYFTQPPLRLAMDVIGIDRMMYSVDYPFSPITRGDEYLRSLNGTLSAQELDKLTHTNAARLLKLKV